MRRLPILVAVSLLWAGLSAQAQTPRPVITARGAEIAVTAGYPTGKGPFPVLILAPGKGARANTALLESVSHAVTAKGIAVYRFDWAYSLHDPNAQPSVDRSNELQDLQTVLDLARKDPAVDPARVAVAGKSLGSFVAWRAFHADPTIKSAVALTPLCSSFTPPVTNFAEYYTGFATETRPSLWLLGDADSACQPKTLYGNLAGSAGNSRIVVLSGNHGLEGPKPETGSPPSGSETAELAASIIADYVAGQLK